MNYGYQLTFDIDAEGVIVNLTKSLYQLIVTGECDVVPLRI